MVKEVGWKSSCYPQRPLFWRFSRDHFSQLLLIFELCIRCVVLVCILVSFHDCIFWGGGMMDSEVTVPLIHYYAYNKYLIHHLMEHDSTSPFPYCCMTPVLPVCMTLLFPTIVIFKVGIIFYSVSNGKLSVLCLTWKHFFTTLAFKLC